MNQKPTIDEGWCDIARDPEWPTNAPVERRSAIGMGTCHPGWGPCDPYSVIAPAR